MFCENCGNKINKSDSFCTECGHSYNLEGTKKINKTFPSDRWWQRILKIIYILTYLQILWIVPTTWVLNSYYSNWDAFWFSLMALVIFIVSLRLIKLATLYIVLAQRPAWKKEFKKLF